MRTSTGLLVMLAGALAIIALAGACASLSGYDPSRYVDPPDAAEASSPDTEPLPREARRKMLDPRSPIAPDASR